MAWNKLCFKYGDTLWIFGDYERKALALEELIHDSPLEGLLTGPLDTMCQVKVDLASGTVLRNRYAGVENE